MAATDRADSTSSRELIKQVMRRTSAAFTPALLIALFSCAIAAAALARATAGTNATPLGFTIFFSDDTASITTCAPGNGSAPTWRVVTAGSACFLSVRSSATMSLTRRRSPDPATNARTFRMERRGSYGPKLSARHAPVATAGPYRRGARLETTDGRNSATTASGGSGSASSTCGFGSSSAFFLCFCANKPRGEQPTQQQDQEGAHGQWQ